ncbi:MAG: hypothetical protein ACHQX1_02745 [Candidatus Micrarchaeales archaeon]
MGIENQKYWVGARMAPHSHVPEGLDTGAAQAALRTEFLKLMMLEKRMKKLVTEEAEKSTSALGRFEEDELKEIQKIQSAETLSKLIDRYAESMRALGTLSKDELIEIQRVNRSLIEKYLDNPTKENLMKFVMDLRDVAPLMQGVTAGWIGINNREPRWAEAASLHNLWNLLHQFLLVDVCLYNLIGTSPSNEITLVGERDEYVDLLVDILNTSYTPVRELKAPTMLVNERPGVVTIILRDVGKGDAEHSGIVTVKFDENSFDFTLSFMPLDDEHLTLQAEEIKLELEKAGIPSKINSEAVYPIFLIGQGTATREKLAKLLNTSRTQWEHLPRTGEWIMESVRSMIREGGHEHHHHEESHESLVSPDENGLRGI